MFVLRISYNESNANLYTPLISIIHPLHVQAVMLSFLIQLITFPICIQLTSKKLLSMHYQIQLFTQNFTNSLIAMYCPMPISSSLVRRFDNEFNTVNSCGTSGQATLGTSTVESASVAGGPFQSISKSEASS